MLESSATIWKARVNISFSTSQGEQDRELSYMEDCPGIATHLTMAVGPQFEYV